jgi:hypothetical protein
LRYKLVVGVIIALVLASSIGSQVHWTNAQQSQENTVYMPSQPRTEYATLNVQELGLPSGTQWNFNLSESPVSPPVWFNVTTDTALYTFNDNLSITFSYELNVSPVQDWTVQPYMRYFNFTSAGQTLWDNITFKAAPKYQVAVQESGLPSGTAWNLTFDGTEYSLTNSSYDFQEYNGSYPLSVGFVGGYSPSYPSYVTVSGSPRTVSIVFNSYKYPVQVVESGLPAGTLWSFTFNGTNYDLTNTSYDFSVPNGTYYLSVGQVSHYTVSYPSSLGVDGAGGTVQVDFKPIPYYLVSIGETGLPSGTEWTLTFSGTQYAMTNGSYDFSVPNGTYPYSASSVAGYSVSYSPASPLVVNGTGLVAQVTYELLPYYSVTVIEAGLPSGTSWNLSFNGTQYELTNNSYVFQVHNGSYTYSASHENGYTLAYSPSSPLEIAGSSRTAYVNYSAVTYTVTISETGLASGISWPFTFNNLIYNPSGTSIDIQEANGTYILQVPNVSGYTVSYPSTVTVQGQAIQATVTFTPKPPERYTAEVLESGLPAGTPWSFTFNGTQYDLSNSSYNFSVINGSYSLSVNQVSNYTVLNPSAVTVQGQDVQANVTFTQKPLHRYQVRVLESGLPSGSSWSFVFNGSSYGLSNSSYNFSVINGSYSLSVNQVSGYSVTYLDSLKVQGSNLTDYVNFTKNKVITYYVIVIVVSNLPANVTWNFIFNGVNYSSSSGSYSLQEPNGTYSLDVDNITGYTVVYPSSVVVSGSNVDVYANFTASGGGGTGNSTTVIYVVTTSETGLPAGTIWYFTINGTTYRSDNSTMPSIKLANGTYQWNVSSSNPGYVATTPNGTATIDGAPFYIGDISFVSVDVPSPPGPPPPPTGSGPSALGSTGLLEIVIIIMFVVVVVLGISAYFMDSKDPDDLSAKEKDLNRERKL